MQTDIYIQNLVIFCERHILPIPIIITHAENKKGKRKETTAKKKNITAREKWMFFKKKKKTKLQSLNSYTTEKQLFTKFIYTQEEMP